MKTVLLVGLLALVCLAQQPDIVMEGSARAKTVRFERRPQVQVKFTGTPNRKTDWRSTGRQNLPSPVQPGTTYRNVRAGTRIETTFTLPSPLETPRP